MPFLHSWEQSVIGYEQFVNQEEGGTSRVLSRATSREASYPSKVSPPPPKSPLRPNLGKKNKARFVNGPLCRMSGPESAPPDPADVFYGLPRRSRIILDTK
ncbi:hypothetical protein CDAR_417231 [Caerostris darwini]|uniref:Uncharacterized protein n=1 Tax=Caerostris darwini TaxID=1538125 RepID=A0AAV4X706_9ARAC|nr:hypothetical protein CDAR_417231 [Caerostris darwini]